MGVNTAKRHLPPMEESSSHSLELSHMRGALIVLDMAEEEIDLLSLCDRLKHPKYNYKEP